MLRDRGVYRIYTTQFSNVLIARINSTQSADLENYARNLEKLILLRRQLFVVDYV